MKLKPGSLIALFLVALVMSAPQLTTGAQLGMIWRQSRSFPWHMLGLSAMNFGNKLTYSPMWRDHFVSLRFASIDHGYPAWAVTMTNPETGRSSDLNVPSIRNDSSAPTVFGDRLFFFDNSNTYELVDGKVNQVASAGQVGVPWLSHFLMNGKPAGLESTPAGWYVSTIKNGRWATAGMVKFPSDQTWKIDGTVVDFKSPESLTCISQGSRIHVFLLVNYLLLYREGLELDPDPATIPSDQPASALQPANVGPSIEGWSLVRSKPVMTVLNGHWAFQEQAMLIGGMPAVLIVDDEVDGTVASQIYRFDGKRWSEFVKQQFPFGTNSLHVVTTADFQTSYIVATTTTGRCQVYAVDANGIRATQGASETSSSSMILNRIQPIAAMPVIGLITGAILGLVASLFFIAKANYGFGHQTVRLSSLPRRGLARLVDLILVSSVMAGLCWTLTYRLDFVSLFEAINLQVAHPAIDAAISAASILMLTLMTMVVGLIVIQGRYGVTPGKWCCGVRVLRITLRPCGFARSLVREVMLSVDSCNLTCWTPGILSFVLTDHRQRLGDLVADTVVVDVKTMKSGDQTA